VKTLDLQEAGEFLRIHPEEVRSRAKRGLIPGAKTGRRWVFLEADLAAYIRSLYSQPRQALQVTSEKELICHYADAVVSGGSTSALRTGSEYAELLGLPTLAQESHDRIKVELWRIDKLGVKPRRTWNDAVVRWLKENGHKATASEDTTKLRWLDRHLRGKDLAAIDRATVDLVTREKLAQGVATRRSTERWSY
jgi:hypothetical protein